MNVIICYLGMQVFSNVDIIIFLVIRILVSLLLPIIAKKYEYIQNKKA